MAVKKRKGKLFIGTSGFHYNHWKNRFYPENLKKKDWLKYYLQYFKTLELNNPFYNLPSAQTFDNWRKSTPVDFVFSIKASRFITHNKKLKDSQVPLNNLLENASWLHEKLGPILFQLPPAWKYNVERLKTFLDVLPDSFRYTFEFRNHSWYNEEVFGLLKEHNIAFCIYELEYHQSPIEVTSDFIYIRLHGPLKKYSGLYTEHAMQEWAERLKSWQSEGKDVYIYFDNDQNAYAAVNAIQLRKFAEGVPVEVPILIN